METTLADADCRNRHWIEGSGGRRPRRVRGKSSKAAGVVAAMLALLMLGRAPTEADERKPDARSSGCGRPNRQTGSFEAQTVDGRGTARVYRVQVASPYDPNDPLSLTIVFHGGGSDDAGAVGLGLQDVPGAAAASIFVFPRGAPFEDHGIGWDDSCHGYDMPFFDDIVASIEADYCVDPTRVFVAGFSWGCDFVTALACCRGDRLGAVAAASCSDEFSDPGDVRTYANATCPTSSRAAVRFTHAIGGDSLYPAPLFSTTAALFGALNHCASRRTVETSDSCVALSACSHPVIDCAIPGIDHAPGPNWAADTWAFFKQVSGRR